MTDLFPNQNFASFPNSRLRRLRANQWSRDLVRENWAMPADLVLALIVHDRSESATPITSLPGINRYNIANIIEKAQEAQSLGIKMIALFPNIDPSLKDEKGSAALDENGLILETLRAVKKAVPDIGLMSDIALDPYTDHGHDGLIDENGYMLNDETIAILVRQSLLAAAAGADVVAPSDMCDGRIGAIRRALDEAGQINTAIMAYSAKYASGFYGPYRDAIGSKGALKGDKKTYQMDFGNGGEALREAAQDIAEGADMIMVKPGLAYLDILYRLKSSFKMPTFAYQVSGEYAMMEAAIANGWLDGNKVRLETIDCFKRAGADGIICYGGLELAKAMAKR